MHDVAFDRINEVMGVWKIIGMCGLLAVCGCDTDKARPVQRVPKPVARIRLNGGIATKGGYLVVFTSPPDTIHLYDWGSLDAPKKTVPLGAVSKSTLQLPDKLVLVPIEEGPSGKQRIKDCIVVKHLEGSDEQRNWPFD